MTGVIVYATKYGSTAEYAQWISDATGLPLFDSGAQEIDLAPFDFLIIVTPVLYYKLLITKWVMRNLSQLADKPVVMVTGAGAPPGPKLDAWVGDSLPADFLARTKHVALRGRQNPRDLTWPDWILLRIAAWWNPDPKASDEERNGFDYMDKESIAPVIALAEDLAARADPEPADRQ